jgi:hypothetical protein
VVNLTEDGKRVMMVGDGSTDLVTKEVVKLFVGFGGAGRRQVVFDEAAVYVEGPGLAGLLPIALSSSAAAKLADTPYWQVFEDGLRAIANGEVAFKDPAQRRRILQGHDGRKKAEQIFGE